MEDKEVVGSVRRERPSVAFRLSHVYTVPSRTVPVPEIAQVKMLPYT